MLFAFFDCKKVKESFTFSKEISLKVDQAMNVMEDGKKLNLLLLEIDDERYPDCWFYTNLGKVKILVSTENRDSILLELKISHCLSSDDPIEVFPIDTLEHRFELLKLEPERSSNTEMINQSEYTATLKIMGI